MRHSALAGICLLLASAHAQTAQVLPLQAGWRLQSDCTEKLAGERVSRVGFADRGWLETAVPRTVLAAQVDHRLVHDPFFGRNLQKLPGSFPAGESAAKQPMPRQSPYRCAWWYRVEFTVPGREQAEDHYWLHFSGINYRAAVWLNGREIATPEQMAGAYRIYDLDVSEAIHAGQSNALAVQVFAQTEKDLGINWVDWNPAPPDKDMGLWGEVHLERRSAVALRSPMVTTHLPRSDLDEAELTVSTIIENSSNHAVRGTLSGSAAGARFEIPVELAAQEKREVVLTPQQFPALHVEHPRLWWPRQMGEPHIELLDLRFTAQGRILDEVSQRFGMREVTSELTEQGSRLFRINGRPLLIRGAGWAPDLLLRADEAKMRQQFRLIRDLNLNTIRLEGKLENDAFFRLADEEGVLVMAGWCCCDAWEDAKNWSSDERAVALASLRAQMLRLRGHPSLLAWLNGSDAPPPPEVERAYLQVETETRWPNPVLSSASATVSTLSGASGLKMSGPYDYEPPAYWYMDNKHGGAFGFNSETGTGPAIPSHASRARFLPDPDAWPRSVNWTQHYGLAEFDNTDALDDAMEAVYIKPRTAEQYERMAQTMAYDAERALFEAYSRNKYNSTGVVQWMLNNAWPSMFWHLYDYWLDAGGGYYGVKKACEPLHIQYSYDDHSIVVVNSTWAAANGLRAAVRVYTPQWKERYRNDATLNAGADSAQRLFALPASLFGEDGSVLFVELRLLDPAGKIVSRNTYWIPSVSSSFAWNRTDFTSTPVRHHEDMNLLAHLPLTRIELRAQRGSAARSRALDVQLHNAGTTVAFQVRLAVRTPGGEQVAPVLWSENWLVLAPGETRSLQAELPEHSGAVEVVAEGWNAPAIHVRAEEHPLTK